MGMVIDKDKKAESSLLDGCYVVETDVIDDKLDKQSAWDRYGDLQKVERDFRTQERRTLVTYRVYLILSYDAIIRNINEIND